MRSLLLFFLLCLSGLPAFSCLNEMYTLIDGKQGSDAMMVMLPQGHDFKSHKAEYEKDLVTLDGRWRRERNIDAYSDYGVRLVYLGRYEEAKAVFIDIERKKPGRYATAANLGTTYELLGKNDSALYWIRKAVAINPQSHEASEWLHVKILEAKIGGDQLVTSKFLLGHDFGNDVTPQTRLNNEALSKLGKALYYQLNERVSFIRPKDKIVALLLFELGNICALKQDVTLAEAIYDKAVEYGYSSDVLQKRYDKIQELLHGKVQKAVPPVDKDTAIQFTFSIGEHPAWHYGLALVGLVLLCCLAAIAVRPV